MNIFITNIDYDENIITVTDGRKFKFNDLDSEDLSTILVIQTSDGPIDYIALDSITRRLIVKLEDVTEPF